MSGMEGPLTGIGGHIRAQREAAEVSLRQLASAAGVSNPYLSQVERGLRRPSGAVLSRIAGALRVSAESLYVQAGLLDPAEEGDVVDAVRRDPALTEAQREALLAVYRVLRTPTPASRTSRGAHEQEDTP